MLKLVKSCVRKDSKYVVQKYMGKLESLLECCMELELCDKTGIILCQML